MVETYTHLHFAYARRLAGIDNLRWTQIIIIHICISLNTHIQTHTFANRERVATSSYTNMPLINICTHRIVLYVYYIPLKCGWIKCRYIIFNVNPKRHTISSLSNTTTSATIDTTRRHRWRCFESGALILLF